MKNLSQLKREMFDLAGVKSVREFIALSERHFVLWINIINKVFNALRKFSSLDNDPESCEVFSEKHYKQILKKFGLIHRENKSS